MIEYTEWFPPEQKPVREGLYLIKYARGSDCWYMAYWHKGTWYSAGVAADGRPANRTYQLGHHYWWRGLANNPVESEGGNHD